MITNLTGKDIENGKLEIKLYRSKEDFSSATLFLRNVKKEESVKLDFTSILKDVYFSDYDFNVIISNDLKDMSYLFRKGICKFLFLW